MPSAEELQRQSQQAQQMGAAFRQMTGGVPGAIYIDRRSDGFNLAVQMPEGSPVSAVQVVDTLIQAVGMCCQQLGMTVKI